MREYFDDSWEVIDIIENVIPRFNAGYHFNKKGCFALRPKWSKLQNSPSVN